MNESRVRELLLERRQLRTQLHVIEQELARLGVVLGRTEAAVPPKPERR